MDIAVFSDIHSNHVALQACFDYAVGKGITNFVLLGDYISDCPNPQKTLEIIYSIKKYFNCWIVKGNREEYVCDYRRNGETGWINGSASGSLLYTYENLKSSDLDFFETLPIYDVCSPKGYPSFEICHGSPTSSKGLLFKNKRNTKMVLTHLKTGMLLHGHNHVQEIYEYRGRQSVNPGSIGIPWFHGGRTQFVVLHGSPRLWEPEAISLEYDRSEIIKEFSTSGLNERAPAWTAINLHTIRTGKDLSEAVLLRAMRLCEEDRGAACWPNIPEKYWAIALKENHIDLNGKEIPQKEI